MRLGIFLLAITVLVDTALIVPRIVGSGDSPISEPKFEIFHVKLALDHFRLDCGRYPTTAEGVDALMASPSGLEGCWKGPYSSRPVDHDIWGNSYQYRSDGHLFDLTSFGADGKPGGEGDDADIGVND